MLFLKAEHKVETKQKKKVCLQKGFGRYEKSQIYLESWKLQRNVNMLSISLSKRSLLALLVMAIFWMHVKR